MGYRPQVRQGGIGLRSNIGFRSVLDDAWRASGLEGAPWRRDGEVATASGLEGAPWRRDCEVATASGIEEASWRRDGEVATASGPTGMTASGLEECTLKPPFIHDRDERFVEQKREARWMLCDGCSTWTRGNNSGCLVHKQKEIQAADRRRQYLAGKFDATWYCVECLKSSGHQDMVDARLKRQAQRQRFVRT